MCQTGDSSRCAACNDKHDPGQARSCLCHKTSLFCSLDDKSPSLHGQGQDTISQHMRLQALPDPASCHHTKRRPSNTTQACPPSLTFSCSASTSTSIRPGLWEHWSAFIAAWPVCPQPRWCGPNTVYKEPACNRLSTGTNINHALLL